MLTLPLDKPTLWESVSSSSLPVALYGTGDGADKILSVMKTYGLKIDHIFVSDDFFRGQNFHGQSVTTLHALESQYNDFLILVAFGSHLPEIHERIVRLSRRHPLLIPDVPVCGDTLFDRDYLQTHEADLEKTYDLWADEASRRVFEQVLDYKLTGRPEPLFASESSKSEVFSELIPLGPKERYLDLGAYRGDTLEEFCTFTGGSYISVTALEPDPYTFRKLQEIWGQKAGISLLPYAVDREPGTLFLFRKRGRGSSLSSVPSGIPVPAVSVDSLNCPVTYLKMDLEGFEEAALWGAQKTLTREMPLLNIACYHRSEDLFRLPLLIHSIQPRYRLFLRRHSCIPCWELNLYARSF